MRMHQKLHSNNRNNKKIIKNSLAETSDLSAKNWNQLSTYNENHLNVTIQETNHSKNVKLETLGRIEVIKAHGDI